MAVPDTLRIRPALPEDAEALTRLHVDVWEDAYADLMPASVFTERRATIAERTDRWRRALTDASAQTTVADLGGQLLGFASIGPARDDDVAVAEELWALYARGSWWGAGVGHALLTSVLADRAAYLWVLRGNDRALSFYRRHGFVEDGVTRTDDYGTELRMTRLKAPSAPDS